MRLELERILAEAVTVDAREDSEGQKTHTVLPKNVPVDQMREILRRVRLQKKKEQSKQEDTKPVTETTASKEPESPSGQLGPRMQVRIEKAIAAIANAEADGRKHLCLTDPDARMLAGESSHNVKEFHSFEIAVDQGIIVATGVTTDQDNSRAAPLVDAALARESGSVVSVTADSGYWRSDAVLELEGRGIDTCIPDSFTACDLHNGHSVGTTLTRKMGKVSFEYDASEDCYNCPEKNRLVYKKNRWHSGRELKVYQAERECAGCPRAADCLANKDTKRRSLHVYIHSSEITAILARFSEREHRERYWNRGPAVETVFGFMRSVLGFTRWIVRGAERVRCEAVLFQTAYQFRKLHRRITLPQVG
jgi:Transposase DDE domain